MNSFHQALIELSTALKPYSKDKRFRAIETTFCEILHSEGYSHEETAQLLGLSASTVKNRLREAQRNG
jgi:predicted transcriptional regulator